MEGVYDTVLRKTRMNDDDICGCFVWGSHLWGTSKPGSDYDVVIVTKADRAKGTIHGGNVDACVLGLSEFTQAVKDHRLCLAAPDACVLKTSPAFPRLSIDAGALYRSVATETERDWERIEKCFSKGDVKKGRKIVSHSLRMTTLAVQLATSGAVSDFAAGNASHLAATTSWVTTFDAMREEFYPGVAANLEALRSAAGTSAAAGGGAASSRRGRKGRK